MLLTVCSRTHACTISDNMPMKDLMHDMTHTLVTLLNKGFHQYVLAIASTRGNIKSQSLVVQEAQVRRPRFFDAQASSWSLLKRFQSWPRGQVRFCRITTLQANSSRGCVSELDEHEILV
jgi:hypothetical protein